MLYSIDWPLIFQGFSTFLDPLAAASWPIAIVMICWSFRKQIRDLISRIKSLKGGGLEAVMLIEKQDISELKTDQGLLKLGSGLPVTGTVHDQFDKELQELLDREFNSDDDTKLKWAIRLRSIAEVYRRHEAAFRIIFGSQLKALEQLHLVGKASASDFQGLYDEARNNTDFSVIYENRTFEQWGQFLIDAGYVKFDEADSSKVEITPLGQDFLVWLTQARIPKIRFG